MPTDVTIEEVRPVTWLALLFEWKYLKKLYEFVGTHGPVGISFKNPVMMTVDYKLLLDVNTDNRYDEVYWYLNDLGVKDNDIIFLPAIRDKEHA